MYELSGVNLLVVEPNEDVRSELVLDLFMQGAEVLVAEGVDEALEVMRSVRLDCVLASLELAATLRARTRAEPTLGALPVVTMARTAIHAPPTVEA